MSKEPLTVAAIRDAYGTALGVIDAEEWVQAKEAYQKIIKRLANVCAPENARVRYAQKLPFAKEFTVSVSWVDLGEWAQLKSVREKIAALIGHDKLKCAFFYGNRNGSPYVEQSDTIDVTLAVSPIAPVPVPSPALHCVRCLKECVAGSFVVCDRDDFYDLTINLYCLGCVHTLPGRSGGCLITPAGVLGTEYMCHAMDNWYTWHADGWVGAERPKGYVPAARVGSNMEDTCPVLIDAGAGSDKKVERFRHCCTLCHACFNWYFSCCSRRDDDNLMGNLYCLGCASKLPNEPCGRLVNAAGFLGNEYLRVLPNKWYAWRRDGWEPTDPTGDYEATTRVYVPPPPLSPAGVAAIASLLANSIALPPVTTTAEPATVVPHFTAAVVRTKCTEAEAAFEAYTDRRALRMYEDIQEALEISTDLKHRLHYIWQANLAGVKAPNMFDHVWPPSTLAIVKRKVVLMLEKDGFTVHPQSLAGKPAHLDASAKLELAIDGI